MLCGNARKSKSYVATVLGVAALGVCCSPVIGAVLLGVESRDVLRRKTGKRKARHERRPPKSFSRRRSLTLPLAGTPVRQTNQQSQSWLFKIPPEIREIIYREVLQVPLVIYIRRQEDRLYSEVPSELLGAIPEGRERASLLSCALGLLSSCRRTYSETIHLLYETNTFHIHQARALNLLPRFIVPPRLSSIRVLNIDLVAWHRSRVDQSVLNAWIGASSVLERMTGLQVLRISFKAINDAQTIRPMPFLEPLMALNVPEFVVEIPNCAVTGMPDESRFPFTLVQRES